MYKIVKARRLADKIFLMDVHAPRVASHCQPGQFIIVKMDEKGERIPLTICDYDREAGTITIVVQEVGASTTKMGELKEGDYFRDFTGPLGCPSEFVEEDLETLKKKKMLLVAGGVGAAPVYPQVKWLREHGIEADVIVGSKTKDMLILEDEMKAVAGNYYPCTDDGACRLQVGDEIKFACVDGPEFDGHLVDFDQAMKRSQMYKSEEGRAMLKLQEGDTHHGGCGHCGGDE